MDFDKRLKDAIDRGKRRAEQEHEQLQQQQMSEQDLRNKHTEFRLGISDHIESCLRSLAEHFPGFEYETIYGDRGWGGAIFRDDLTTDKGSGKTGSFYSRLEITVKPYSQYRLVDVAVRGTVFNREVLSTSFYEEVQSASVDSFLEKVDFWSVTYAENFAAR